MKTEITLCAAVPNAGEEPLETTIHINGNSPTPDWTKDAMVAIGGFYDKQAEYLCNVLVGTLPQATTERLIIKLLQARALYFRIPGEVYSTPELVNAVKATLMFYDAPNWTDEKRAEWTKITGQDDATTRVLANTARAALDKLEKQS